MKDPNELVQVYTAPNPIVAGFIQSLLEESGVMAFVEDATLPFAGVTLNPIFSPNQRSGCGVLVPARDLERARHILQEARETPISELPEETDEASPGADLDHFMP